METFFKAVLAILIGIAVGLTVGGYVVMIMAGMIHHEVESLANVIPAWSFRESVFVSLGLTVLGAYFKNYSSSKD